jgi:hypothetical protein
MIEDIFVRKGVSLSKGRENTFVVLRQWDFFNIHKIIFLTLQLPMSVL